MKDRALSGAGQRAIRILGTVLAAAFGLLAMRPISSFDFWWHLSMGKATLSAGSRTFEDPIGLAAATRFTNIEWLFDVLLFEVYRVGGAPAVQILIGMLSATAFLCCWKLATALCGRFAPWTALTLACLVFGVVHWRFMPRPHAAFMVFLPLAMLLGVRVANRFRTSSLALVGLFVVWAQSHSSIVIAPLVVACSILIGITRNQREPRLWWLALQLRHLVLLFVLAALTLTSAQGFAIVGTIVGHTDTDIIRHIQEMQPAQLSTLFSSRSGPFLLALLTIIAFGLAHKRRVELWSVLLFLLGIALLSNSVRFKAALAYLCVPLAASVWRRAHHPESRQWAIVGLLAAFAVPSTLAWRTGTPSFTIHEPNFAVGAAAALETLEVSGPLFNFYDQGGYLGWTRYGHSRVVIDGRTQILFNSDEFFAARLAKRSKVVFDALDRVHGFSAAVLPRDAQMCSSLAADADWSAVWTGERHVLFMPKASTRYSMSWLPICAEEEHAVVKCRQQGDLNGFLEELEIVDRLSPTDPYLSRIGAQLALQCLAEPDLDRALEFLRGAASREPDHPDYAWSTALVFTAQNQLHRAAEVLAQLPIEHLRSQLLRLNLFIRLEQHREAVRLGRELVDHYDDSSPPELRDLLAISCERVDDRDCAVQQSLRAALEGHRPAQHRLAAFLDKGWVPNHLVALARGAVSSAPG